MGKRTQCGVCSVCGEYGELTFEHIPPRSCYNDCSVKLLQGMDALQLDSNATPRHRISQRGAGDYYTCGACNSKTGGMYVPETRAWVARGAQVLSRIGGRDGQDASLNPRYVRVGFFSVRPLLFLKQVAYMFLCVNGPGFARSHPELRRFVLYRDSRDVRESCHFSIGLTWGPAARSIGGAAMVNFGGPGATYVSDISFPPFHYVMWTDHPFRQLVPCEITHFKELAPSDVRDVTLLLQVGFTHTGLPGDLRSKAALERQIEESSRVSDAD